MAGIVIGVGVVVGKPADAYTDEGVADFPFAVASLLILLLLLLLHKNVMLLILANGPKPIQRRVFVQYIGIKQQNGSITCAHTNTCTGTDTSTSTRRTPTHTHECFHNTQRLSHVMRFTGGASCCYYYFKC